MPATRPVERGRVVPIRWMVGGLARLDRYQRGSRSQFIPRATQWQYDGQNVSHRPTTPIHNINVPYSQALRWLLKAKSRA